jgi:glutaredoxin/glutathione-dependent peroxiredoxin
MTISTGDNLPGAALVRIGDSGPETVQLSDLAKGNKIVLFGLPGAFTRTCSATHLPSFIRTADAFRAKGVTHLICLSVNDPFVMKAWDDSQGASAAGVEMLADGAAEFTKAAGLEFTAAPLGFIDRCKRFSAYVEDGVVKVLNMENAAGTCELTAGETLLEQI